MEYCFSDCTLDDARRSLTRGDTPVAVEPQVFDLLLLLVENADRVVTRDEMVDVVWGGRIVSESAISARIAAARKAVGDDGKRQAVIGTVARRGLKMSTDVSKNGRTSDELPSATSEITQRIRYTKNARGHSIAYAVTGSGSPIVRVGYNLTHLEEEWKAKVDRPFFDRVGERHTLIRFDPAGIGLSEPGPIDVDFDAMADDILAVATAAGFDQFAILTHSGGVLPGVRAAARAPERVKRLVVMGGYVDGRMRRHTEPEPDAIRAMLAEGWSSKESAFTTAYMMSYFPEGPLDAVMDYVRITTASCPRDQALRIRDASNSDSIAGFLAQVRCPTLIIHSRDDGVHPISEARKLAINIPDAELVILETANLIPLPGQPEWPRMMQAVLDFLDD
ncbi:alpha/beta fold hydrolase [Marimonas sp. MJW-29]|uniref:Alpha/beta fold hydrolase n=1 Tax=Sulfitobacter sediminis TaxID=3234186 RepID=A0ABV3RUF7_9RHOB